MLDVQDGADQGKGSVFDRLGGAKPASAATRLSNSAQSVGNARQTSGTLATPGRPVNARDAVVNSVQSIARLGRSWVGPNCLAAASVCMPHCVDRAVLSSPLAMITGSGLLVICCGCHLKLSCARLTSKKVKDGMQHQIHQCCDP